MSETKFTIHLDFKGKEELNSVVSKLLQPYNIDAKADFGKIHADIEKNIVSPMRKVKTAFMEWGLVINGIQGALNTAAAIYQKTFGVLIDAAAEQEAAEVALRGALRSTGLEIQINAKRLIDYAAQLQNTTIYGDEMLMKAMAQMQNIARFDNTNTLMQATKAAIGLSAAFGIDLSTAMDLVGKAGAGNTGMLGRYGIVLDETASQAEKFNQVLEIGAGYFGLAEDQARTSAGSLAQLKNAWGDFQETLAEGLLPAITNLTNSLKPMIEYATAMSSEQKAITLGLVIMNALVVKQAFAVMANRAAFAALTLEQQRYMASIFANVAIQKGAVIGTVSFSVAMKGLGASFVAAGAAVKGFLVSIGPVGWIIIGITAAYAGLNAILKVNTKVMKDKYDAEKEALELKKEQISKSQSEENAVLKLTDRYQQLAGQAKRNKAEQRELAGIHQKLADKYPSLISTTGSYGKSLDGVKGAAEQARKALADLGRQQWQTELSLAKNSIENTRIEAFEALSKDFNWRDIWFSPTRGTALAGVKEDMETLLNNDSSVLSESYLKNLSQRLDDLSKKSKTFSNQEQVALQRAATQVNMMLIGRQKYNGLLKDGLPDYGEKEDPLLPKGGTASDNNKDHLLKRLDDFKILQDALFDLEKAETMKRERQYQEDLLLLGNNEELKGRLRVEYLMEVTKIEDKYQDERASKEKKHYDELKFMDSSYYEWKKKQIQDEGLLKFPGDGPSREAWLDAQTGELDKDKAAWENKAIADFERAYSAEMSRLAELRELGLATHSEIAAVAWEHHDALKAIVEADGEISEGERELLDIYRKRGQMAQLAVNRDSDLASYYNEIRFHDSAYSGWKKARIEEDVRLMDLSEEQKTALIKVKLDDLKKEIQDFTPEISVFDHLLAAIDIPEEHQAKIKNSFQSLANQISAIWSQLFTNLASTRDQSLKNLETRAKKERKSEAWLAKEKEKVNADYEKKYKALKRTEQKIQIASATANTLEGITNALTIKPAWLAPIMAASAGALGFAQVKLIAEQKFARGGDTSGLFRGKGTTTSDSNIIAISDREYIIAADRVKSFGVPFFDALNFGNGEHIRSALASLKFPVSSPPPPTRSAGFASGGSTAQARSLPHDITMNVTLKCDGKKLAKAVIKGKKKIIST